MKTILPIALLFIQCLTTAETIEIMPDQKFQNGFRIIDPKSQKVDHIEKTSPDGPEPSWRIAQWSTRFPFPDTMKRRELENGAIIFEDETKSVEFHHEDGMIILGLDSITEYEGKFRDKTQGWPHILVSQNFKTPFLSKFKNIKLSFEARIIDAENKEDPAEGYTPSLHASQFQIFFIVQDAHPDSVGKNQFYWHGVPLYDSRKPFHKESGHVDHNPDMPEAGRRYIYVPNSEDYNETGVSLQSGKWVKHEADLLALIKQGLEKAKDAGAFPDSPVTLDHYKITHINIGWEMPGMAKARGALRNFSVLGELK